MEYEPERGKRCTMCFDMRFERTALYAYEHGFDTITSSLGISRWKILTKSMTVGYVRCPLRRANLLDTQLAKKRRFCPYVGNQQA